MQNWSLSNTDNKQKWPKDSEGKPIAPVFLEHILGSQIDVDMELNLLAAYEIPVLCAYPNNGEFGKLILGFSGTGVDFLVPETMLEDARNIISYNAETDQEI